MRPIQSVTNCIYSAMFCCYWYVFLSVLRHEILGTQSLIAHTHYSVLYQTIITIWIICVILGNNVFVWNICLIHPCPWSTCWNCSVCFSCRGLDVAAWWEISSEWHRVQTFSDSWEPASQALVTSIHLSCLCVFLLSVNNHYFQLFLCTFVVPCVSVWPQLLQSLIWPLVF